MFGTYGPFWLIFVGLVLLSIGAGTSMANATKAGGWVVLAFAVLAWYHAANDVIAATFGRKLLPMGPRRSGRQITGGRLVGELEQDRGPVVAMARSPQITQVRRRAYGASAVQATQVPGYRRAQVELVQQAERDEPGSEIGFQGPALLPGRRLVGEKNEVHGVQVRPRSASLEDERDPARLHGQPGFLQRLSPGASGHALAWTRRASGKDPVVVAVTDPPDQENIRAAEDDG